MKKIFLAVLFIVSCFSLCASLEASSRGRHTSLYRYDHRHSSHGYEYYHPAYYGCRYHPYHHRYVRPGWYYEREWPASYFYGERFYYF